MRYAIPTLAILLFFSSCSDNSKRELAVFRAADEGLWQSVNVISQSNEVIYRSMQDKLADPQNTSNAMIWQPKAIAVKALSDTMVSYIRQLKEELKDETGFSNPPDRQSFREDNIPTVSHYFKEHNKGEELFNRLIKYKGDILAVDSQLNNEFKNNIGVFAMGFDPEKNGPEEFTKTFFGKVPVIAAMAMLSKFENNVKIIENKFIVFCHNKTGCVDCGAHDKVLPVVMQNSTNVKAGEEIIVTAGIAMFTNRAGPVIIIGGKPVSTDFGGVAYYKLRAPASAGKYTVPVKIEFFKPDGTKEYLTKNITYTVEE